MKEILVLRDLECIKAIAHPKRIDILKAFNNLPLSAKQLSQILDEPHAKINYHIKTLYKVGILELVEEKIKSIMGTKVNIHQKAKGKGKIEIEYYSDKEFERIFDLLMSVTDK